METWEEPLFLASTPPPLSTATGHTPLLAVSFVEVAPTCSVPVD